MVIKRHLSLTHTCTLLLSDNRDQDAERSEGDLKDTGRVHVERGCAGKRSSKGKVLEAAPRGRLGPEEGDQMHRQAMLTRARLGCDEERGHYSEQKGKSLKTCAG